MQSVFLVSVNYTHLRYEALRAGNCWVRPYPARGLTVCCPDGRMSDVTQGAQLMASRVLFVLLVVACGLAFGADNPVVTVLDFQVDQVSDSEMRTVISLLSSALFRTGRLTVIDVTERDSLLKEIEFSVKDCTDQNCQLEIGKLLAAEYIVVGRFAKLGKRFVLSVKMLETATSRTVSAADGAYTELDEVVRDMPKLATQLAGAVSAGAPKAPASRPAVTPAARPQATIAPVRIAALASAGGAVACAAVATPLLIGAVQYLRGPVETAFQSYMAEPEGSTVISSLYTAYLGEYDVYRRKFIPGAVLAGGTVALGVLATVLFVAPAPVAVSVVPLRSGVVLSVSIPAGRRQR